MFKLTATKTFATTESVDRLNTTVSANIERLSDRCDSGFKHISDRLDKLLDSRAKL